MLEFLEEVHRSQGPWREGRSHLRRQENLDIWSHRIVELDVYPTGHLVQLLQSHGACDGDDVLFCLQVFLNSVRGTNVLESACFLLSLWMLCDKYIYTHIHTHPPINGIRLERSILLQANK